MLVVQSLFSYHRNAILAICLILGCVEPLVAAQRESQSSDDAMKQLDNDTLDSPSSKTLHGPISIEESIRLRRDLDEYSRMVDPAHVQIEERRRIMHQKIQSRFSETDRDNDGSISREEAMESMPQVARHFNRIDSNGDGVISLDELEALQARMLGQRPVPTIKAETPDIVDTSKRKGKDTVSNTRKRAL